MNVLSREAHVWWIDPESVHDPDTLQSCRKLLDHDERGKLERFMHASDRHHYMVAHTLLRQTLSRYADIAPANWRFVHGAHGRPEISPDLGTRLRFNLTHTPGLCVCIVTLDDDCGIDAEKLRQRCNPLGVARRMFSESEYDALTHHEGRNFLEYFYEHWTLREAYVKARGIGISFPTRQLCFTTHGEKVSVEFDDTVDDCNKNWHFQLIRPNSTHIVALALRNNSDQRKHVVVSEWSLCVNGDRF